MKTLSPVRQVQIIADGLILQALMALTDGIRFDGQWIKPGTRLIVFANMTDSPGGRRSRQTGLKMLQRLLAHRLTSTEPVPILILSMTGKPGRYRYLTENGCGLLTLPVESRLIRDFPQIPTAAEWRTLIRTAAETELEINCSAYRHNLNSLMAATRIFLGAAIIGHVPNSGIWESVLSKLEKAAQIQNPEINFQRGRLINYLKEHKRFAGDYHQIKKPARISVQILDDNFETHGWETVLKAVFSNEVRGFATWPELEETIRNRGVDPPDVLLLDCNLGEGNDIPTGLELLYSIRSEWPEVRIVFLTAFDDAALALTSIREGANFFFAKALNAQSDRRSLDYYRHFAELLNIGTEERKISRLWRRLRDKMHQNRVLKTSNPADRPEPGFERLLRLGFFIIFSEFDNLWWNQKAGDLPSDYCFRAMLNLIQIGFPKLEQLAFDEENPTVRALRASPHASENISFADFESMIEFLLSKLQSPNPPITPKPAAWARPKPADWPYSAPALQNDSTHPGLPAGKAVRAHDIQDHIGAVELITGIRCLNSCRHEAGSVDEILAAHRWDAKRQTYPDVIFIDDKGKETEWFKTIETVFPACHSVSNLQDALKILNAESLVNLVILDLRLPTYDDGIKALDRILTHDPSIPVLTVSAGSDSIPAIRSLRRGAIDFVAKTLPFQRDKTECFEFADEFLNKCALLLRFGKSPCRNFWRELNELQKGLKWKSPDCLTALTSIIQKCADYKKSYYTGTAVEIPPQAGVWAKQISEELNLILNLRRQVFWMEEKIVIPADPKRFNFERTYQIRPIDGWRREHILELSETSDLVKLIAISCGILVERLAKWNWCLINEIALNSNLWGLRDVIVISREIKKLRASNIWYLRNVALGKKPRFNEWNQSLCDELIEETFAAVRTFLDLYGAYF